jgi:hypothetical protein
MSVIGVGIGVIFALRHFYFDVKMRVFEGKKGDFENA